MKNGRSNPGILVVDRYRSFQCNSINKSKDVFNYVCCERLTIGVKCTAKAVIRKCEVEGKGLQIILAKVFFIK